ncbi:hypothetical protein LSAT2_027601 [Lamellibrachia satsuma]|nr:hypothetical protein LSAT2_027601 [Lamellibrachia satsuma]
MAKRWLMAQMFCSTHCRYNPLDATDTYEEEMETPRPSTSSAGLHTSPRTPTPPMDNDTYINIHRSNIQREMIVMFTDPSILDAPIKVRFKDEAGADADGLSLDAYSAFWKEFFLTSACGEDERVPPIFPDYGRDEWEDVGRILLKGYLDTGGYPLRYVIDKALCGDRLDEEDKDDFLDLLSKRTQSGSAQRLSAVGKHGCHDVSLPSSARRDHFPPSMSTTPGRTRRQQFRLLLKAELRDRK